ncbi:hypothetical protein [Ornithinibacillus contaminans]|uniref:hypothetical protein n=1 Tax=Ornithinibacillus contaminans TaxID=694055 RepID=UPI00064DC545|nr:hypothetical protein [Ornithinibacillus contaminans]
MFKEFKNLKIITLLEVELEFPLMDDFSMFISKDLKTDTYIISIPHLYWHYETVSADNLESFTGPSGFNHPTYKSQLAIAIKVALSYVASQ